MAETVDLLVVGGGINGAGIARDAVGRGLSVVLCEARDLAAATSSASSKLIHGGLRYLEYYEFRLVREALIEREVLLKMAPHIIWPLRFVLPHQPHLRPAWMIRAGLFLYDHLGGRDILPASEGIRLSKHSYGQGVKNEFDKAFVYSDAWVEDARLVALNAVDAAERGAVLHVGTKLTQARRDGGHWIGTLTRPDGSTFEVRARALVNAAGPWVMDVLGSRLGINSDKRIRLIKGSHIVVPKLHDGDQAFILQNDDKRIVFVIPYQGKFSLIGTTDIEIQGDPGKVAITPEETDYLCSIASRYFQKSITASDVVWSYSGVRPLYDDASSNASAVTRDYVLDLDTAEGGAPLLNIFGGKITTYRKLAEHAVEKLQPLLGNSAKTWSGMQPLPGGDISGADFEGFAKEISGRYGFLPPALAYRYARAYGTRMATMLNGAKSLDDLGRDFGGGVYEVEADYLKRVEWAGTAEAMLWRRSKLGLHVGESTKAALEEWFAKG
ncbi:glycerol-3-phosphate dehydrogenase [Lacibacterium aquatile]|uniref:Glycerol-3-phosphate dehydrogenase n=1 Tax=Lacibacterium aquatile TaxID=1168082 RepID=A0ABW5DQS0_9PROT